MENREKKTYLMLVHKIEWKDIMDELDITKPTLYSWRKSGDTNKNEAIDYAVQKIIDKKDKKRR